MRTNGSADASLDLYASCMETLGNTLDDFPAESFTILVFCEHCGHNSPLDRAQVPERLTVQQLLALLRCKHCGSRDASIRIIYTGAGGFEYGTAKAPSTL